MEFVYMSKIKAVIAFCLALVLCLSLVGCHSENEVALTIGGVEISSAMYGCALIQADLDARAIIDGNVGTVGLVDYSTQTIDQTPYDEWVENRALNLCKLYAAYTLKMQELKIEADPDTLNNVYNACYTYWLMGDTVFSSSSYTPYATIMEPNGVSWETYIKFNETAAMDEAVFNYFYGIKGTKKLSDEEINKYFTEHYALIYNITLDYNVGSVKATEEQKKEVDTFINTLKTRLEAGEDFATIKADLDAFEKKRKESSSTTSSNTSSNNSSTTSSEVTSSGTTSSDVTSSETTSSGTSSETKPQPKDKDAVLVYDSTVGSNADTNFANIKIMAVGDVKLIETSTGWRLIKKIDLMSDTYYRDENYLVIANLIKGEEFGKEIQAYADSLTVDKNGFAMGQYTVDSLEYPV